MSCDEALRKTSRQNKRIRRAGFLFAGFLLLCAFVPGVRITSAASQQHKVLFLSSYTYAFPTVPSQIEGVCAALEQEATIEYLFMDTKNLRDNASYSLFYEVCKNKLDKNGDYDAVILGDDAALQFAMMHADELFDDTPLVFQGVNDVNQAELADSDPLITGVAEVLPYTENIQAALELYPEAQRIVGIVDNTETGVGDAREFLKQEKLFPQLSFSLIVSSELTPDELCAAIAAVDEATMLFSFSMNDASDGTVYSMEQQSEIIRTHARVPVFRPLEPGMGQGYLGGKMISSVDMGRMAGEIALRVLNGEDVSAIPVVMQTPTRYCYDYTVMQTYGIAKKDVPANAVFLNDPIRNMEHLRPFLIGMAVFVLSTVTVVGFMLRDNRRHRATAKALRTATAHLAYTAHFDTLTGVYRRAYFFERTQELLERNPNEPYVIFRTDIQRFRVVNDLYGSETGDLVLVQFGRILREYVGEQGTCARFQADNFLGCVPRSRFDMQALLNHLDTALHGIVPGHEIVVTLGVYEIDDISLSVALMCDRASIALQSIKGSVVNRCAWYDVSLRSEMLEEQSLAGSMKDALANGEFCVYYQPIYDLITEKPISAEALVRWQHPTRGLVSPGMFIPLFERNGFITNIDAFMFDCVCQLQRRRTDDQRICVPISLNVSRVDFSAGNLSDEIVAAAARYDLPKGMLKLEVTESAYTENPRQIMDETDILRRSGFPILMDDFGSGYSSLNMLKDLPVDVLKLDICFLQEFRKSGRTAAIMHSVVEMAKNLEMCVIAEGVETSEQVEFLRSIGCDAAQGYYFARPMPEEEFCALLERELGTPPSADAPETLKQQEGVHV